MLLFVAPTTLSRSILFYGSRRILGSSRTIASFPLAQSFPAANSNSNSNRNSSVISTGAMTHHSPRSRIRIHVYPGSHRIRSLQTDSNSGPFVEGEVVEKNNKGSAIIKEHDKSLELEQTLKDALNDYRSLQKDNIENNNNKSSEKGDGNTQQLKLVVSSLEHIRGLYEQLEYWDDALATQRLLLDEQEKHVGSSYSTIIFKPPSEGYGRMGRYHLALGNVGKAKHCCETSLRLLQEKVLASGKERIFHADIGRALNDLATISFHRSNVDLALDYLKQAQDHFQFHGLAPSQITEDVNDMIQPHPELVKVLENLALMHRINDCHELGLHSYQEALEVLDQCRDFYQSSSSSSATTTKQPDNNNNDYINKRIKLQVSIADCYQSMDDDGLAEPEYKLVLKEIRKNRSAVPLDDDSSDDDSSDESNLHHDEETETALEGVILHNLGLIFSRTGRNEDALETLLDAYHIKRRMARKETGSESHPEVAKTLNGLGAVHAAMGNRSEALSYFSESLLIARMHANGNGTGGNNSGENDPQVIHALRNIALVKGDMPPVLK